MKIKKIKLGDRKSMAKFSISVFLIISTIVFLAYFISVVLASTTFTTEQVESVSLSPLDTNKFVVAWCDEASNDVTFKIYDTNGTTLRGPTDVDTSGGNLCSYDMVSVSAFNSTHFVLGWYDSANSDITFVINDTSGSWAGIGPVDADTDAGSSYAVDVSAFNSTHFVIGWWNASNTYTIFAVYTSSGTLVTGPINVDTGTGPNSDTVSVSALNSTHFVIGWYDSPEADTRFAVYTIDGSLVAGPTNADGDSGAASRTVSVSALNSTHFVIGWYDNTDGDITFSVYDIASTLITGPTDADANVSANAFSVSVSALNSTHFVIGWYDNTDVDHTFAVYASTGTLVTGPIDSSLTAVLPQAVASYQTSTNIGFCYQNFVHAFSISTVIANFTTYEPDGTSWDGSCAGNPPTYVASSNATNTTNAGQPTNFTLSWGDDYGLAGYIFSTNNTGTWENASWVAWISNPISSTSWNVTTLNSTKGTVVGWCVYANDTSNNWNGTSCQDGNQFTLTTSGCSEGINPPASGVWNITENTTCEDMSINVDNFAIQTGKKLTLSNVKLTCLENSDNYGDFIIKDDSVVNNPFDTFYIYTYGQGLVNISNSTIGTNIVEFLFIGNSTLKAYDSTIASRYMSFIENATGELYNVVTDPTWQRVTTDNNVILYIENTSIRGDMVVFEGNSYVTLKNVSLATVSALEEIDDNVTIECLKPGCTWNFMYRMYEGNPVLKGYFSWINEPIELYTGHTVGMLTRLYPFYFKYLNGTATNGRNIYVYNSTNNQLWSGTTDSNGFVWVNVTQNIYNDDTFKIQEEGGNYVYVKFTTDTPDDQNVTVWENNYFQNITDTPDPIGVGRNITLQVNVTGISPNNVWVNITYPNSTVQQFNAVQAGNYWQYNFSNVNQVGTYYYQFIANVSNDWHLSPKNNFSTAFQTNFGIRTIKNSYLVTEYVNLTDPFFNPLAHLNWNYIEKLPEPEPEENRIKILIQFKDEPLITYEKTAEKVAEEKSKEFNIFNIFKSGETVKNEVKAQLMEEHENNIEDIQENTLDVLKKKYNADLYNNREFSQLYNGIAILVNEKDVEEAIADIEKMEEVKKVFINPVHKVLIDTSVPAIDADKVWLQQNATGSNITGQGVKVAVLDTGIDYTHEAFGSCTLNDIQTGNCKKIIFSYDFVNDDDDAMDDYFHGTHVAGIIGANGTKKGVAPDSLLMAYKVCDAAGNCPDADIIAGIENATLEGADIISMSLGGAYNIDEDPTYDVLENAWNNGTLIVASAGNSGPSYDTADCPACMPFVISVGATNDAGTLQSFSSRGFAYYANATAIIKPDVVAPGYLISSSVLGGGYASYSGTSMSCPHVSGVAALVKQAHPDWNASQLFSAIVTNAERLGSYNANEAGSGFVNAYRAYNISSLTTPTNKMFGKNKNASNEYWNVTAVFEIKNNASYSITYNLSLLWTSVPSVNLTLNASTITLSSGETKGFELFLNVTNNTNVSNGRYYGKIKINSTPDNLSPDYYKQDHTIPFVFVQLLNPVGCPEEYTEITSSTTLNPGGLYCTMEDYLGGGILRISADNVVFDCNGTTFDGVSQNGYGIYSSGYTNITMKNCNIKYYYRGAGIYASPNVTLIYNTINNSFIGMDQTGGWYGNISHNRFYDITYMGMHFGWFEQAHIFNNTFKNVQNWFPFRVVGGTDNNIFEQNTIEDCSMPVYVENSNGNLFFNNTFINGEIKFFWTRLNNMSSNNFTYTGDYASDSPIDPDVEYAEDYFDSSNTVNGKPLYYYANENGATHSGVDAGAVIIHTSSNLIFKDSTVDWGSIRILGHGENITIQNVTINNSNYGARVDGLGGTLEDVNLLNLKIENVGEGFWILGGNGNDILDVLIENVTVNNTHTRAYRSSELGGDIEGVVVKNSRFTYNASAGQQEYFINNERMINTTWVNSEYTTSNYIRQWWLEVNATDNRSEVIKSVNITIADKDSNVVYNGWTGDSGMILQNITEYTGKQSSPVNKTPHTIYATKYGYITNSTTVGLTDNKEITIVLNPGTEESMINNTGTTDIEGYLLLRVDKYVAGSWVVWNTTVNDASPRNISAGNYIALDQIWDADGGWYANQSGTYRVYVEFRDADGNTLLNDDGSSISAHYIFDVSAYAPQYSNPTTNNTAAGDPTLFSLYWNDDTGLSHYRFSFDNCTGSFVNDSWSNSGWEANPTAGWSNASKVINSTIGCTIKWKYYANDTDGNEVVSSEYSFATTTTFPTYSSNSTNSTTAGTPVLQSLNWADNAGLSGYIFSFDNCTGTLTNDTSWVAFSGGTWSNVTKNINSTVGCTIRWCVYANDTSNNWNGTSCNNPFSYLTTEATDTTPPTWQNAGSNVSNIFTGGSLKLYSQCMDETALNNAWYATNETGTWKNYTKLNLEEWSYSQSGSQMITQIDFGDVLSDYGSEIAFDGYVNGNITLLNSTGQVKWSVDIDTMDCGGGYANWTTGVSFGDINNDGKLELGASADNGCAYLLNATNGNLIWSYNANITVGYGNMTIATEAKIGNFSGQGVLAFVGDDADWAKPGYLIVLNSTGQKLWNFSYSGCSGTNYTYDVSIGDVNGDGINDVGYVTCNKVFIFNSTGQQLWNYTFDTEAMGIEIGNVSSIGNSVGNNVVVSTTLRSGLTPKIFLLNSTGHQVWNYSMPGADADGSHMRIANITGDYSENEIIATTYTGKYILFLNSTGSQIANYTTSADNWGLAVGKLGYYDSSYDIAYGMYTSTFSVFRYNSPRNLFNKVNTWTWSNFTWQNTSITNNSTIAWRIYCQDAAGNTVATDIQEFNITLDTTPPTYSNNQIQLVTIYTPTGYSNFSITWNDNSGSLVHAYLENNFTTLTNTTMSGSYPNYYYNTTSLKAGTYRFRFIGIDFTNNENATNIQYFTISKAPTSTNTLLNGTDGDKSYNQLQVANFTVALNVSGKTVKLNSNMTGFTERTGTTPLYNYTTLIQAGTFYINGSFDGDENYTASFEVHYFTVNDTTAPTISSVQASGITSSTASITWTTNENSNSSLVISPSATYSNSSSLVASHSISLSGMTEETTYHYNVTSCDASGNCNTSTGYQFNTSSEGGGGGGDGGGECTEKWNCTAWSTCVNGKQNRTCKDLNNCGTTVNKSATIQNCTINPPLIGPLNISINTTGEPIPNTLPNGSIVFYPTRFAAVISNLLVGNMQGVFLNIIYSMTDYYHKPKLNYGPLNVMFMHITIFIGLYVFLGLIIRWIKLLKKFSTTFKALIYFIVLPLFCLFVTLLLPSFL